jgi:hypothetical protein
MAGAVASAPREHEMADRFAALLLPARLLESPPDSTAMLDASVALYTLGPAVVHAVHGQPVRAVASPAIRAFAPTAGTLGGFVVGGAGALIVSAFDGRSFSNPSDAVTYTFAGGIAAGYLVGFAAPILLDATLFGHEPVEKSATPNEPNEKKDDAAKVTWSPRVGWTKDGPNVGLSGTF